MYCLYYVWRCQKTGTAPKQKLRSGSEVSGVREKDPDPPAFGAPIQRGKT